MATSKNGKGQVIDFSVVYNSNNTVSIGWSDQSKDIFCRMFQNPQDSTGIGNFAKALADILLNDPFYPSFLKTPDLLAQKAQALTLGPIKSLCNQAGVMNGNPMQIALALLGFFFPSLPGFHDPLVLDLQGAGLNLTSVAGSPVSFDFTGSGVATQTGWITPGEGFLVLDNGSGNISQELLGADSGDGFADLRALDANGDGVINASDPAFSSLKVWIDQNSNGQVDSGELVSLGDLGITSISLATTPVNGNVNGNVVVSSAAFSRADGSSGTISEVDFQTAVSHVQNAAPADFNYSSQALLLPDLDGYGDMSDFRVAMTDDSALLGSVESLIQNASSMAGADFNTTFQSIMLQWAGVSGVSLDAYGPNVNGQHLAFICAYYGIDVTGEGDPNALAGPKLEAIYQSLIGQLETRFVSQVAASEAALGITPASADPFASLALINWDPVSDTVAVDSNLLVSSIAQAAPTDPTAAEAYYDLAFSAASGLSAALFNDTGSFAATVLSELATVGVSVDLQETILGAIGFTSVVDEAANTGVLTLSSVDGVVFLGTGDKSISGGSGNVYVFDTSGGNDVIADTGTAAQLVMSGIASTDVVIERPSDGNDLVIVNSATGSTLAITGYFSNANFENVVFSDGLSLTVSGTQQFLRSEAIAYLASTGDSFASQQAQLALFGFTSVVNEGAQTGSVSGSSGAEVLLVGTGDKTIAGDGGADIYVYSANGGNVVINDAANNGNQISSLVMNGVASTAVTISRPNGGNDFVITNSATGDTVTVSGEFAHDGPLADITFSDGVTWDLGQVQQILLDQESATSGETIYGYNGTAETLVAGVGDRLLNGEGGADTYVYSSAGGNDIVVGEDGATLEFSDIASTDVTLSRPNGGTDLVLSVTSTGESVTVQSEYANGGALAAITFADGVTWSFDQVQQMLLDQESATPGATIYGFAGRADTLVAGVGDRLLNGEGGADTYVYSSAGGNDIVVGETGATLEFGDIASTDVTLSQPNGGGDLVITVTSTGKTVTVQGEFANGGALAAITFSDGVSWSFDQVQQMLLDQESATPGATIYGFAGRADTLVAGVGDRLLNGEGGADTYVYSSAGGNDIVVGEDGATLEFSDIASTDVTLSRPNGGTDLVLSVTSTGESVTVQSEYANGGALAAITFADGVTWSFDQVQQMLLDQESATPGATIYGFAGRADTLVAGVGDRLLNGEGGADTYVYSSAGGNDIVVGETGATLEFGDIASTDVTLSQPNGGGDLVITVTSTGKTVTVQGEFANGGALAAITFSDGVSWDETQIADILSNGSGPVGQQGYLFNRGTGHVTLSASSVNFIEVGPGISADDIILQANGFGDLTIAFLDSTDSITIPSDLSDQNGIVSSAVSHIEFSDGTSMDLGQAANGQGAPLTFTWSGNTNGFDLTGSDFGTNIFDVSAPDNSLMFGNTSDGGSGFNILNYALGAGRVSVTLNGGTGVVQFGSGVTASDVDVEANGFGDLTLIIAGDPTDSVVIDSDLRDTNGVVTSAISALQFSDGTSINLTQDPLTFTWAGSANGFNLSGSDFGTNVFDVTASGSVTLGNASDGGGGQNVINYAKGAGSLGVFLNGGNGIIQFGAGVRASDIELQPNSQGDLGVLIASDTTDSIDIHSDLTDTAGVVTSQITALQFSDGTSINLTQDPLTFTWAGSANGFNLSGSDFGTNVFDVTASGSVTLGNASDGGGGQNVINYAKGAGSLGVFLNGGNGIIQFGAGVTASDIELQPNSQGDLGILIAGDTTDGIDIHTDLTDTAGVVSSAITALQFSDGTSINLAQDPITFTWVGSANGFSLSGSDFGTNAFDVTASGNVTFGNASDGGGQNVINYAKGSGSLGVFLNGGDGIIQFGAGVTASDIELQPNSQGDLGVLIAGDTTDSIDIHGDLTDTGGVVTSQITALQFSDGTSINIGPDSPPQFTWVGTANASLSGSGFGANTFILGAGSESVTGGGTGNGGNGNNTYVASSSTGQTTIHADAASGSTNELQFVGGITDNDLWFQQSGNDLTIDLLGTNTQVDVSGWFSSSSNQLQEITAGGLKIDSQVSQLVQAMATYSSNNPGFDPTSSGTTAVPNDANLQSAVAAAWHA